MSKEGYLYISCLPEPCTECPILRRAGNRLREMQDFSDKRIPHIIDCAETHWVLFPQRKLTALLRPQKWMIMNRILNPASDALYVSIFGICKNGELASQIEQSQVPAGT
jgi:hypothetical protein